MCGWRVARFVCRSPRPNGGPRPHRRPAQQPVGPHTLVPTHTLPTSDREWRGKNGRGVAESRVARPCRALWPHRSDGRRGGGGGAHSRSGVVAATDMALCQEVNTLSGGLLGTEPPRKQDGRSLSLPPHSILHSRPQRSPAKPNTN
jgi:hypothetical protein